MKHDSIIKNGAVVFPFHGEVKCDIGIIDWRISTISDSIDAGTTDEIVNAPVQMSRSERDFLSSIFPR